MTRRPTPVLMLALICAVEGVVLVGYAAFDIVEAVRVGITGPEEVSNPMALVGLIAITALLGLALLWLALGWWRGLSWVRAPFVVAELIIGLIGFDLAQASGSVERAIGTTVMAVAGLGLIMAFLPAVGRAVSDDSPAQGE